MRKEVSTIKKTLYGLFVGFFSTILGIGVAFADAPSITLDPIGSLSFSVFPQEYNVTGTIFHEPNATSVSEVKLFIDGVQMGDTINPNVQNVTTATFSLPWTILEPGTYDVKVTARHGDSTGEGSEEVEVTLIDEPVVIAQCPAAPSIAAHYLKDQSIKAGSKAYKNVISLVAQTMEPQTMFEGVAACDENYATVVKNFVDNNLNFSK